MSPIIVAMLFLLIGIIFCYLFNMNPNNRNQTQQRLSAPGPPALPVIGHLHKLGKLPHRSLHAMAQKHGPIMSLRLGQVPAIVVSSPEAAEQVLKTHDAVFSSRPSTAASEYLCYGARGIALTPFGPYWRRQRQLCANHLMTAARIESFAPLRRDEVRAMVARLEEVAGAVVDLSETVSRVMEEITFKMLFGSSTDVVRIKRVTKEGMRLIGTFNLADYVPFLGPFDPKRVTRQQKKTSADIDVLFENIIKKVQENSTSDEKLGGSIKKSMSFIEVLMSMVDKSYSNLDDQDEDQKMQLINVKAIIADMVGAGLDAPITAIEWILSELLKHPQAMTRLQQELNKVVGIDRMVEESDLPKLTYLDMVIMESFRLYPVAPFLIPRESMEDVEINGYFIPKKTRVLVNTWAIGRDSNVWSENVESCIPERFMDSDIGFRGNDFRFTPFGSGRRRCPGMQLGLTAVRLVVAQVMHCFNWELPKGILARDLDMSERFGQNISRINPLLAVPTRRLSNM